MRRRNGVPDQRKGHALGDVAIINIRYVKGLARRSLTFPLWKAARWRCCGGYAIWSLAAISASPEWLATKGGHPHAAASAATG